MTIDVEAVRCDIAALRNGLLFPWQRDAARDRILATITHLLARAEQAEREVERHRGARGEFSERYWENRWRDTDAQLTAANERVKELEREVREQALQYLATDGQACDLQDQLAAAQAEVARWKEGLDHANDLSIKRFHEIDRLTTQLAARDAAIAESLRRADADHMHLGRDWTVQNTVEPLRQFQQPEPDNRPVCSADGCHRREPCGFGCRDNGNFDKPEPDKLVEDDAIDAMLSAIDNAGRGYSIRLTRLVDDVATYTLTYRDEQHEFDSHEAASDALAEWKEQECRDAVKQFLAARGGRVVFDGEGE